MKGRADDEMSLGSSDDEISEGEFAENDPDYKPSFFDDDDYVPRAKTKKKQWTTVQKKQGTTVQKKGGQVVQKKQKIKERPLVQGGKGCNYSNELQWRCKCFIIIKTSDNYIFSFLEHYLL